MLLSVNGLTQSPNSVRLFASIASMLAEPVIQISRPLPVRWGPKTPKKCQAEVIQSAFLWTQFYETQLHIHRMFALRGPSDPELSAFSMNICVNAAKQCIFIMESVWDIMITPFHCFLLIVSFKFRAV